MTTPATTEAKAPSKMERCKALFAEIFAKGYDLQGKSQRKVFIERAMAEVGMSKPGANTYYQNLSNAANGKSLYKYNQYQRKTDGVEAKTPTTKADPLSELPGTASTPAPTKTEVKKAEQQVTKTTLDMSKRWHVQDADGQVIGTFDTRAKAKEAAIGDLKMVDSEKKAS